MGLAKNKGLYSVANLSGYQPLPKKIVVSAATRTFDAANKLKANTNYVFDTPVTNLTFELNGVEDSLLPTGLYFTTDDTNAFTLDNLAGELKVIGNVPEFELDTEYEINICNKTMVVGKKVG